MLICVKCLIDMGCEKNGVIVARDPHYVQAADLYKCPECGFEVLTGAGSVLDWEHARAFYDRVIGKSRRLFRMDKKEILEAEAVNVG